MCPVHKDPWIKLKQGLKADECGLLHGPYRNSAQSPFLTSCLCATKATCTPLKLGVFPTETVLIAFVIKGRRMLNNTFFTHVLSGRGCTRVVQCRKKVYR